MIDLQIGKNETPQAHFLFIKNNVNSTQCSWVQPSVSFPACAICAQNISLLSYHSLLPEMPLSATPRGRISNSCCAAVLHWCALLNQHWNERIPPPKPLFVNGVSCSALDRWEVYKWAGREVRIIHEDTKFYFIFKDKNQVWHSHNFFLPCITLEENFINRVTSRFRSFVMHYNWMNCLFFYIDCLSFFPLTPILFPSPVAFN